MLILKQSRLKKEEPTLTDFCVYLAGAAFPMERLFRGPIAPQCVNVNYGECAIALVGNYRMTHSIGSCASAFGGHGQTVSGWNSDTRASASRTFHAAVSALTIDKISVSAVLMWKVSGICIAD